MTRYTEEVTRDGITYRGVLTEHHQYCEESVTADGETIHWADFHAVQLGDASRSGYVKSMTSSIAYKHSRRTEA
ncbi:hypothetical protein [Rhizobium sp. CECT 9324]|uniref:hypothetical protein n=1 Tax=Rhizobium sp. CECT 9324 TaxID=2845820 RepID=UPI001E3DC071|nr:hypothetical protein [Rhizobium sp. CECT 9324]CAH0342321.1 hypothetical protein RHI9324_04044 [Rhizobium sp. CECT 9324]CAH0343762.1 hypothetical protein RHI9324_05500 [Rhizobium sp. CECT 9324]